ncbi:hypothetical protein GCM10022228_03590 [Halomonas cibimaris]|uniref:Transposase n=1 Tax=Halomonas cibimaris TaxID=657012 RepID=A0ABP7L8F2_9GAMM
MPVSMVCDAFNVSRSSYYDYRQRRQNIDANRLSLRAMVRRVFTQSRDSAGSHTIKVLLNQVGISNGRFKVRRLMRELGLASRQPGPYAYWTATVEKPDFPNLLAREFTVSRPDRAWCGDITYIWTGQQWSYLAVVMDLYARRVVGWSSRRWIMPGHRAANRTVSCSTRIRVASMPAGRSFSGYGIIACSKA